MVFLGTMSNVVAKILVSSGKEKQMTKATIVGAIVNASLNAVLIYYFSHRGAAFASSIAELSVIVSMLVLGSSVIPFNLLGRECWTYPLSALAMGISIYLLPFDNCLVQVLIGFVVGVIVYFFGLIISKERLLLPSVSNIFTKLRI